MRQNRPTTRAPSRSRPAGGGGSRPPPLKSRNGGGKKTTVYCPCTLIVKPVADCTALNMQQAALFTDLLVRTTDNVEFPVHRWVLLGVSSHFMPPPPPAVEAGTCSLSSASASLLPTLQLDMAGRTMEEVIHLAYTGTCRKENQCDDDLFVLLLKAAHRYDIDPLLKSCGDRLLAATAAQLASPSAGATLVANLRLAQQYLCGHVVDRLAISLRRKFRGQMGPAGAALMLSPPELARLISWSDLPLREAELAMFILTAAATHGWTNKETAALLEHVRFTLLTREELVQLLADKRMAPFVDGLAVVVDALTRVRQANGLLPVADMRQRLRPMVLPHEEPRHPGQVVLVMGGWAAEPPGPTDLVEAFNYITETWQTSQLLKLPVKRAYHGLIIRGSQVFLIGGYDADGPTYHNSLYVLDMNNTRQWRQLPSMLHKRCYIATLLFQDKILALGGHDGTTRHNSVESFDPTNNHWSDFPSMTTRRSDLAVVTHGGRIFAIGGFTGEEVLNTIEVYDPDLGVWSPTSPMVTRRSGVSAVLLEDKIYVLGGFDGTQRLSSVECFTPGAPAAGFRPTWHSVPDMLTARSNFSVTVVEGKIFVSGGYVEPTVTGLCEMYCPVTNTWTCLPDMNLERSALNQVVVTWDNVDDLPSYLH